MATKQGPHSTPPGPSRYWFSFRIWAEDGLIALEDDKDGSVSILSIKEAEDFIRARNDELQVHDNNSSNSGGIVLKRAFSITFRNNLRQWIEAMYETIKDARMQGDYFDPEFRKKRLLKHLREKRAEIGGGWKSSAESIVNGTVDAPLVFGPHTQLPPPSKPVSFPIEWVKGE